MLWFWIWLFVGLYLFAQILYPLLYGFPRALRMAAAKELRWGGVLWQLLPPLFWCTLMIAVGFVAQMIGPSTFQKVLYVSSNPGAVIGQFVAIGLLLAAFFSPARRAEMRSDFEETTVRRWARDRDLNRAPKAPHVDAHAESSYEAAVMLYFHQLNQKVQEGWPSILNWLEMIDPHIKEKDPNEVLRSEAILAAAAMGMLGLEDYSAPVRQGIGAALRAFLERQFSDRVAHRFSAYVQALRPPGRDPNPQALGRLYLDNAAKQVGLEETDLGDFSNQVAGQILLCALGTWDEVFFPDEASTVVNVQ